MTLDGFGTVSVCAFCWGVALFIWATYAIDATAPRLSAWGAVLGMVSFSAGFFGMATFAVLWAVS